MRRVVILTIAYVLFCALVAAAQAGEKQGKVTVFSSRAVSASGTVTSAAIPTDGSNGIFGYFLQVAGSDASVKLEVLVGLSEGGTFYQYGESASDNVIVSSFGPTSGRNSDGVQCWYFSQVPLFPFIKIKATNSGTGAATVTFMVNVN